MADSSNQGFGTQQPPCLYFDGENYDFWCVKMKTQLISNDVWEYVENGYDDIGNVDNLTNEQKQQLKKEHKRKDARALSMIQQGVSDKIFPKIMNEEKAKGAWDILQNKYGRNFKVDPSQPNLFDTQFNTNNHPMDPGLYNAVRDGKVEDLNQYTDQFDTHLTPHHNTILHVAAHFGKLECVAKILEMKPYLLRRVNVNYENPLHIAVREQHYEVALALIEHAKKVDLDSESGAGTRLEILRAINVDGDTALHLAVREEDNRSVSLLAREDPDFQHPPNKAKETPLYLATERRKGNAMVESILAFSTSPAYTGPSDKTALHAAVIFGNTESLKKLLDRYEELIDKVDKKGWTPLHYAATCYNFEPARELLNKKKSVGYTRANEKHDKITALHLAAAGNNDLVMNEILSHCPDCWEMVNSKGRNILHIAMDVGAKDVILYIIRKDWLKSLMNQKDFEGNTPLHVFASSETLNLKPKDNPINHHRANNYAFNRQNKTPGEVAVSVDKKDLRSWRRIVTGRRNVGKLATEESRREMKTERKEYMQRFRAKQDKALKDTSESHMLVATLIATITFAAAFAIPGGYNGNEGPEEGMAVLVRQASFKAFVIANTIAVMCSTSSVVYYVFAALYYLDEYHQGRRYAKGFYLVLIAIVAMTVGFITGTYAMLVHSLGLAIATSIVASITFLIYFLELLRVVPMIWLFSVLPWQQPMIWFSSVLPWQRRYVVRGA